MFPSVLQHRLLEVLEKSSVTESPNPSMESLAHVMRALSPIFQSIRIDKENVPYGRYLLHEDAARRFNIQLDVFSNNYAGQIHCHGTWGMLWILKGYLFVSDWEERAGAEGNGNADPKFVCIRQSILHKGSGQAFTPVTGDWHQTNSPNEETQTISLHVYGPGFNMDEGIYINEKGEKQSASRSPFKAEELLFPYIHIN